MQPPLWPPNSGLEHPQLNDTAEATGVPTAVPDPGGVRARKGNERSKCWEARREPAQPRSSNKGLGL